MTERTRDPWSKFYWSDWRSDPKLRACGLAARGLWVEMLGLMHEAEPYGHLLINGKPPTDQQLAVMVGASVSEVKKLKRELAEAGVPTIDGEIWISRRMVRDAQRRAVNQANGKGGGNPKLTKSDNRNGEIRITDPDKPSDKSRATRVPEARSQKPDSEAIASGADAPPAPLTDRDLVWGQGLEWLAAAEGRKSDALRPLVGRWCSAYGAGRVLAVLSEARGQSPPIVGPVAWCEAALKTRSEDRHEQADQANSRRSAERVAAVVARLAGKSEPGLGHLPGGDAGAVLPAVPGG